MWRRCRVLWRWLRRQSFEWWAKLLTISYLSLFLGTVTARIKELMNLPLNELGDFAAGAFGPLAFLWLVLGFRQQGRELQLSSAALQQQAVELQNSVEQQSIIAASALKQIEAQALALEIQLQERERSMTALFSFEFIHDHGKQHLGRAHLKMTNHGGWADHVTMRFEPRISFEIESYFPVLKPGESRVIVIDFPDKERARFKGVCNITYVGIDKKPRRAIFNYEANPKHSWAFLKPPYDHGDI